MASEDEVKLGQTRAAELNHITGRFILRRTSEINNRYLPPKGTSSMRSAKLVNLVQFQPEIQGQQIKVDQVN